MEEAAAGWLGLLWSLVEWVDREGLVLVGWCEIEEGMDPERDLVEWRRRWDKPPRF